MVTQGLPPFKTTVIMKFQIEGTHNWPTCPFEEVAFLRVEHRHMFHFTAEKIVTHTDRDVEIIMLKREMKQYLGDKYAVVFKEENGQYYCKFGRMSCEELAAELATKFDLESCEVLEDGENGAKVYKVF